MLLNYQQKHSPLNIKSPKCENIFLIHGLFGSLTNLSGLATVLQVTHRVILIDLRNHGKSPQTTSMTYHEMANDLFELADHLNIINFSIVGHSMGGKVAMTCALLQPERIEKVVIVDIAPIRYSNKHQTIFKGLKKLTKKPITSRKSADLLLSHYIKMAEVRHFLLKSLQKKQDNYQLLFNLPSLIANYDQLRSWPENESIFNKEILFIKGGNSDYICLENKDTILRLFPKAKAKVIANTGHWLHTEKAKIFNRLVSQFFT